MTALPFEKYRRTNIAEMRPIVPGEDLRNVSISQPDQSLRAHDPATFDLGFVARHPQNHAAQWYVSRAYFDANFEAV